MKDELIHNYFVFLLCAKPKLPKLKSISVVTPQNMWYLSMELVTNDLGESYLLSMSFLLLRWFHLEVSEGSRENAKCRKNIGAF